MDTFRFFVVTLVFCAGMGLGVALETIDNLILNGGDEFIIWVNIGVAMSLYPLSLGIYYLGKRL